MSQVVRVRLEDSVEILSTGVDTITNELVVALSRPWSELDEALRERIFEDMLTEIAGAHAGELEEGWTVLFVSPTSEREGAISESTGGQ